MKRVLLILLLVGILTAFYGCCKKCKAELELCRNGCKETPPQPGSEFTLSIIMQKDNEKNRFQTIFVESPDKTNIGNSFALAGYFTYESYDDRTKEYINVNINKIGLRRLSGKGHKITDVAAIPIKNDGEKNIIRIFVDTVSIGSGLYDEHIFNSGINFPTLGIGDVFETNISFDYENEWGPRICELYVSEPSQ